MCKGFRFGIVLISAVLVANTVLARGGHRPRSPTVLDGTTWVVIRLDGQRLAGRALAISFYNNGRVQLITSCSYLLAGNFHVGYFRSLTTDWFDTPLPRMQCSEGELRDEALAAEMLSHSRRFTISADGQAFTLRDVRGRVIEATKPP